MLVTIFLGAFIKFSFSTNGFATKTKLVCTDSSDFHTTQKTAAFVDKTLMIKEFMAGYDCIMVSTPRRFGKSTNMDMIKRFCEVTVDENGTAVAQHLTSNYKLFTTNNLKIYEDGVFFDKHFGKYPVIYLDFRDLHYSDYESFMYSFKELIWATYNNYEYLLKSHKLSEEEKKEFKRFYYLEQIKELEDDDLLLVSVNTLSFLLYTHFNKTKCIVLIDDYDAPVQENILYSGYDVHIIIRVYQNLTWNLLKSNPFVERAFINSRTRISRALTAGTNNIEYYPFTETHPFNEYFGFTGIEVERLAEKLQVKDKLPAIREWYDGYKVGNLADHLYNVYSVVNYFKYLELRDYWETPDFYLKLEKVWLKDKVHNKIDSVLRNRSIEIKAIHKISVKHAIYLRKLLGSPERVEMDSDAANLYLNIMLDLGYFTITEKRFIKDKVFYTLKIPNRQIRTKIMKILGLS